MRANRSRCQAKTEKKETQANATIERIVSIRRKKMQDQAEDVIEFSEKSIDGFLDKWRNIKGSMVNWRGSKKGSLAVREMQYTPWKEGKPSKIRQNRRVIKR
jgi:hypothetical protein